MNLTPNAAFEHVKESVVSYLETAYKIAHPAVFAERGSMLRERGVIAQSPFIEATPAFPAGSRLVELEQRFPEHFPSGLAKLVEYGVPVDRFPLYVHQEEALTEAVVRGRNLLVATGTGSGKTESFLLPILADLLREAKNWPAVSGTPLPGRYDGRGDIWLHGRRHEVRPAALRAIVLYPMNALVNDQLSRLRRILARGESPRWQSETLRGNQLYFAMYTSATRPTGSWANKPRRDKFARYLARLAEDWDKLREDLRETGFWPKPESPEMLCRWDIQQAPPDILVTNYSMLEYMLVRPIESPIFERTRQWLKDAPDARFTLVLDEAHTYTGAKGTEVAYLVRRLKQRLGLQSGSPQFRAIATTASVPNIQGGDASLRQFTADLFGEPSERFSLVRAVTTTETLPERNPKPAKLQAFQRFYRNFDVQAPVAAITQLGEDLGVTAVDVSKDPQVALHDIIETNSEVQWTRMRTARRATLLDSLARELWGDVGNVDEQAEATAGVLAAGSFARPSSSTDTPPLLSMRFHAFFRGVAGVWACMDPECPAVADAFRFDERPIGKLYTDPRMWCDCGARVLELFSCRQCGLLFLGGIPDHTHGSLWPWSDDLSGERQNIKDFQIFGVESPHREPDREYRSTRTTLNCHPNEPFARIAYPVEGRKEGDTQVSNFPGQCPRCQNWRQFKEDGSGREIIEPLRTKGPQSFAAIIEDGFRLQPRARHGRPPNHGRKALLFTDSRQDAAILAADLRKYHYDDLFRQLLYRVLYACVRCNGGGEVIEKKPYRIGEKQETWMVACPDCKGTGTNPTPTPLPYTEVRARTIHLQQEREIDPTGHKITQYFTELHKGNLSMQREAEMTFNVNARREIAEDEFALEPFGLAAWRVALPERPGEFSPLTEEETKQFLQAVIRILSWDNILLPPEPFRPWEWPEDRVPEYQRQTMLPAQRRDKNSQFVPYNLSPQRKLGRYVRAVAYALLASGRLATQTACDKWVNKLHWPLWQALKGFDLLIPAASKVSFKTRAGKSWDEWPRGIKIDLFALHPIEGNSIHRCTACRYVMGEAFLNVCLRCGQQTEIVPSSEVSSYYRRAVRYAHPGNIEEDPYPLRAIEHSAQIPNTEARDIERWFQDLFHDHQNQADHRIDILSVTTTMEMGIDIGSLLCVGLRNVPPTVANYQQRAGRAGRRGSSVATVLTFAQPKSHDQYYFASPPEIVSEPPRVPSLYLDNEVIARRHVRSVVLQKYFNQVLGQTTGSSLFGSWGTIGDFVANQTASRLRSFLARNLASAASYCAAILPDTLKPSVAEWLTEIVGELETVVARHDAGADLLVALIQAGLLPKYAFPVDVVSLSIPSELSPADADEEAEDSGEDALMQRDLKIALAEYAPGAEVIRGSYPRTFIYRSAGVYDPYQTQPDYSPTGTVVECRDCQSIEMLARDEAPPLECRECGGYDVEPIPYLRPPGFTVDASLPEAGRQEYSGGGRERAGFATPARLQVGETAFRVGRSFQPTAPNLYVQVRVGDLFICNRGPDRNFPGFLICPVCGRALSPDHTGPHNYPANVPPHFGRRQGPRSWHRCPNRSPVQNQVLLAHTFHSEVILLGVDLPPEMDAPFTQPSGRAVWYSFGTLIANASARVLQINPGELKVGVRAVNRGGGRIHGEVFLYDDVPGGAGYARAIERNLAEILLKAFELGQCCTNPACNGACYQCMYEYGNQSLHPLLDRALGAGILAFLLNGTLPKLDLAQARRSIQGFAEYARAAYQVLPERRVGKHTFPCILKDRNGTEFALWPIHTLMTRPSLTETQAVLAEHGLRCAVHTVFDLERRPFWVFDHLL